MSISRADDTAPLPDVSYATIEDDGNIDAPFIGGDDVLDAVAGADSLRRAGGPGSNSNNKDENEDADEEANEEIQDYRGFAALLGVKAPKSSAEKSSKPASVHGKKQISSQLIRKGEKDFEEHGTRAQRDALEQSRSVMESVLAYTRVHGNGGPNGNSSHDSIRGWYFPDVWADEEDEPLAKEASSDKEFEDSRRFIHTRHRVVMVEVGRGTMFASVGAVPGRPKWIKGLSKAEQTPPKPGYDRVWLLPEEALFLVERGSLELWYPLKPIEVILGAKSGDGAGKTEVDDGEEEDGILLSLQAAYSLLIGPDIESSKHGDDAIEDDDQTRGRIALPSYQVYTHLRRSGYQVLRAVHTDPRPPLDPDTVAVSRPAAASSPVTNLWQWLSSLVGLGQSATNSQAPLGPLLKPGIYRSYDPIYAQLRLASSPPSSPSSSDSASPFRIVFHVWKAGNKDSIPFTKSRPPPPDFYMAVADAHTTGVPTVDQITALLASVSPLPPKSCQKSQSPQNPRQSKALSNSTNFPPLPVVYRRLKLGRRCVIVSVVDHGIVNYMRFADGTFGTEPLYPRFDAVASGKFAGRGGGKHGKGAGAKGQGGGGGNKGGQPSGKPGGKATKK